MFQMRRQRLESRFRHDSPSRPVNIDLQHPGIIPKPIGKGSLVEGLVFADTTSSANRGREGLPVIRPAVSAGILTCSAVALWFATPARADGASTSYNGQVLQTAVVEATAIPGAAIDADKVPGNVQTLDAGDLTRGGNASLTGALDSRLGSVNVNDPLHDPFQPDILYRGFEASPVLGTPEGLAVYQNGVRVNEAFGDAVNWDLVPDIAIDRVTVVSSNPVYGLNALGGAVIVGMKDGFSYDGNEIELSGGAWGQRSAAVQYGTNAGPFGFYIAARGLQEDGWRQFSKDRMRDVYAVLSAHTDKATLDLSYTRADNALDGQGPAPVQELTVNRSLVLSG